tara:strand:- start:30974 stop:32443 length:1470 start_codon:yes stop_codon:yes gene_type:complete
MSRHEPFEPTCSGVQPLTPRLEPWMRGLLTGYRLETLVKQYGSPLNIQSSEPFKRNLSDLNQVAQKRGVKFKPFFARKANKCLGYIDAAHALGCGIDTASLAEVEQVLQRRVPGSDIVCTAAVKTRDLLQLCVDNGVTIIIDNADELDLLSMIAADAGRRARIGLRLCGFKHEENILHSRFGFPLCDLHALVARCEEQAESFDLIGLHFHLNGYDANHRVAALRQVIPVATELKKGGRPSFFLDIGGGIPMRYLEQSTQWDDWCQAHGEALLGAREPITRDNHGIGRLVHEGKILGTVDAYPPNHPCVQQDWLASILDAPLDASGLDADNGDATIAQTLVAADLELRCEPGRSVLDGCGMTVAAVQFRKRDSQGNLVVGVTMNSTQCRTGFKEFMLDPLLVPKAEDRQPTDAAEGYLAGTYCTESEWLSLRKMRFPMGVSVGDLVVFANTAGYLMHFRESRSHQFDLAKNIFLSEEATPDSFVLDEIDG